MSSFFWAMAQASAFGVGIGIALIGAVKLFFGGYITEKGKNLATKEDIADLTRIVEGEKDPFARGLEGYKAINQMRMAAADRRLVAHQEAFELWHEIGENRNQLDLTAEKTKKCRAWWVKNCLYLEAKPREAFIEAIKLADDYFMAVVEDNVNKNTVKSQANHDALRAIGLVIASAVEVTEMTPLEMEIAISKSPTFGRPTIGHAPPVGP